VFRGGWYGVMDEGFTGLWRTAVADPRLADLRGPIASRARCIAGIAVQEQADAADAARYPQPSRVQGAWLFNGGETRMDDQQHTLGALVRAIPIVAASRVPGSDDEAPPAWLWVVALLLALNPARAAFGIPRAWRSVAELAVIGGAIGALFVCVAAAVGDVLLDALDVSAPSAWTAAGIVAVLAGAVDLIARPPRPEPGLPGRLAALVPVAIPVVARPALLVLALAAGNVLVSVGAMAVDGPGGRVLVWAGRVVAAALVCCGVLLAIDGILAV
jgi:hypothetical protein